MLSLGKCLSSNKDNASTVETTIGLSRDSATTNASTSLDLGSTPVWSGDFESGSVLSKDLAFCQDLPLRVRQLCYIADSLWQDCSNGVFEPCRHDDLPMAPAADLLPRAEFFKGDSPNSTEISSIQTGQALASSNCRHDRATLLRLRRLPVVTRSVCEDTHSLVPRLYVHPRISMASSSSTSPPRAPHPRSPKASASELHRQQPPSMPPAPPGLLSALSVNGPPEMRPSNLPPPGLLDALAMNGPPDMRLSAPCEISSNSASPFDSEAEASDGNTEVIVGPTQYSLMPRSSLEPELPQLSGQTAPWGTDANSSVPWRSGPRIMALSDARRLSQMRAEAPLSFGSVIHLTSGSDQACRPCMFERWAGRCSKMWLCDFCHLHVGQKRKRPVLKMNGASSSSSQQKLAEQVMFPSERSGVSSNGSGLGSSGTSELTGIWRAEL